MTGTILNIIAIVIGGSLGVLFGARVPERVRQTVVAGLGLFVAALGLKTFFDTHNSILVLGSVLVGGLLGEWWRIEDGLRNLGIFLEQRFSRRNDLAAVDDVTPDSDSRFVRGFLTASLVFCIGPIAILGSIQDGLTGDYQLLAIKSVLDGFASLAFASTLGAGVIFSVLPILVYQGGITLLAAQMQSLMTDAMIAEMNATGGVLLLGIAISSLLEIKKIRVGSFLPALIIAPLLVAVLAALHIQF
jgi:hypothetical protein